MGPERNLLTFFNFQKVVRFSNNRNYALCFDPFVPSEFASLDTDESGEITLGTFVSWAVEKNQDRDDEDLGDGEEGGDDAEKGEEAAEEKEEKGEEEGEGDKEEEEEGKDEAEEDKGHKSHYNFSKTFYYHTVEVEKSWDELVLEPRSVTPRAPIWTN